MIKKYKLKICTFDDQPIIKASAERLEDFDPLMKTLKKKFGGSK